MVGKNNELLSFSLFFFSYTFGSSILFAADIATSAGDNIGPDIIILLK